MGYHVNKINKGVLGEFSKIQEEVEELYDAFLQGNKVLEICELCDLLGSIKAYASRHYKLSLDDLDMMERATAASFKDGTRVSSKPVESSRFRIPTEDEVKYRKSQIVQTIVSK